MKALKKMNKKGFTLVEIIVVLVIIAILAAAAIPTMLGFVNDARDKALTAEARAVYVAAQYIATEAYATKGTMPTDLTAQVNKLAGTEVTNVVAVAPDGKVTSVTFNVADGRLVTITAGGGVTISK